MNPDLILRTSVLLMLAAILARVLHRAAPATRHLVWHTSVVLVILTPLLVPLAPRFDLPVSAAAIEGTAASPQLAAAAGAGEEFEPPAPAPIRLRTVALSGSIVVAGWFVLCWLLSGIAVKRGSRPAPAEWLSEVRNVCDRLGLPRDIEVRETVRDGSPHVAGLFRSVVMMPPSAARWSPEERQAALVHELTHIRRGDRRTQAMAQLACAIYWFNPLAWYAAAGLARERERACDDEVLRAGIKPSAYAALLLDIARRPASWTPAAALSMARPSTIEGRLLSILANAVRTPRRSTRWLVAAAVAAITTAVLGAQPATSDAVQTPPAMPAAQPALLVEPQEVMPLTGVPDTGLTEVLVNALGDASGQVREQAALGLALTPGNAVIDPLLAALRDRDSQVREKAAIGLAFRRDPRVVDPLLRAMSDEDGQVREKAAIALGASGDTRAIAALKKATTDPDPQVREKAVAGLVLLGLGR